MIRTEQLLIWLGVASLAWMSIFLAWGDHLDPELIAFFSGEGTGVAVVLILFLASLAGLALFQLNLLRGRRAKLKPRLFSVAVFFAALAVFGVLYSSMPDA